MLCYLSNETTSCLLLITVAAYSTISVAFPWSQFIASAHISSSPSCLTQHTSRRRGSQQGEGQLRGDFNLSEKIHIKPLMPPFTILPLCLPRLPCSLPGTNHSSLPPLPSSSCHLIQITELASVFLCLGLYFAWQMDRSRRDGLASRGASVCVCLSDRRKDGKGKRRRGKNFGGR